MVSFYFEYGLLQACISPWYRAELLDEKIDSLAVVLQRLLVQRGKEIT